MIKANQLVGRYLPVYSDSVVVHLIGELQITDAHEFLDGTTLYFEVDTELGSTIIPYSTAFKLVTNASKEDENNV